MLVETCKHLLDLTALGLRLTQPSFKVNDADRNRKNAGMLSGLTHHFSLDKTLC